MDHNYNFIKSFELVRFIFDDTNSIDSIVNVLKNSISEQDFKQIIHRGIKAYYKECNEFGLINNVHKEIKNSITTSSNTNNCKQQTTKAIADVESCNTKVE